MSNQTTQKKWLIKDDDFITGPFTESEINRQLQIGEINPTAMACLPDQTCWVYLINYPEWTKWAEKIPASADFTKSLSHLNTNATKNITFDTTTGKFMFTSTQTQTNTVFTPSTPNHPSEDHSLKSKPDSNNQTTANPPPSLPHSSQHQPNNQKNQVVAGSKLHPAKPTNNTAHHTSSQKNKLEFFILSLFIVGALIGGVYFLTQ